MLSVRCAGLPCQSAVLVSRVGLTCWSVELVCRPEYLMDLVGRQGPLLELSWGILSHKSTHACSPTARAFRSHGLQKKLAGQLASRPCHQRPPEAFAAAHSRLRFRRASSCADRTDAALSEDTPMVRRLSFMGSCGHAEDTLTKLGVDATFSMFSLM